MIALRNLIAVVALAGCSDPGESQILKTSDSEEIPQSPSQSNSPVEAALLDQISCKTPPQAGVAMAAMLSQRLIAETDDGGDGIRLFVPMKNLSLLGFPIVRLSGWQADPDGGAMKPFSRGPGTAPPNFISITVRASEEEVHSALADRGIPEASYVPDEESDPWVDSAGNVIQPQRLIPGPAVQAGDDEYAFSPIAGTTTIVCSADTYDFDRAVRAQFSNQPR